MLGSDSKGRGAGGLVTGRQRLQLFFPVAWARVPSRGPLCYLQQPERPLLPVDKVLILIALHLILNGGLQVPDALEGQL